jgi:hypothetical protein
MSSNEGSWAGDANIDRHWGLDDTGSDDGYGLGCEAALPGLQWLAPCDTAADAATEPAP